MQKVRQAHEHLSDWLFQCFRGIPDLEVMDLIAWGAEANARIIASEVSMADYTLDIAFGPLFMPFCRMISSLDAPSWSEQCRSL